MWDLFLSRKRYLVLRPGVSFPTKVCVVLIDSALLMCPAADRVYPTFISRYYFFLLIFIIHLRRPLNLSQGNTVLTREHSPEGIPSLPFFSFFILSVESHSVTFVSFPDVNSLSEDWISSGLKSCCRRNTWSVQPASTPFISFPFSPCPFLTGNQ